MGRTSNYLHRHLQAFFVRSMDEDDSYPPPCTLFIMMEKESHEGHEGHCHLQAFFVRVNMEMGMEISA